jgi:hypothetical protein
MVVKIESRSFSTAEIQHFRTENTRSVELENTYDLYVVYRSKQLYSKLAAEKDRDSIFRPLRL